METNISARSILALSDGRAGNVAMALGLAEAVAAQADLDVLRRDIAIPGWVRAMPPRLWPVFPAGLLLATSPLRRARPRLVVGAGRRVAPYVAALRRARGSRAVQILDSRMPPTAFDAVVTPEHDGLVGENVLRTLGSVNRVTPDLLASEGRCWNAELGRLRSPCLAVLIGGATRRTALSRRRMMALEYDLAALEAEGVSLMVTASRRTGEQNIAALRAALPDAWFWDGRGDNPYFGMLSRADAILVTDDSVNMASEAAAAGKPLAIYPLLEEGGKIARFHAALFARGLAEPFSRRIPQAHGAPLDETGRIARQLVSRFGLDR